MRLEFKGFAGPVASLSIISLLLVVAVFVPAISKSIKADMNAVQNPVDYSALNVELFPEAGFKTKIILGDVIPKLVESGAIDFEKMKELYSARSGLTEEETNLLTQTAAEPLVITPKNVNFLLNVFWALGIANKNPILDEMSKYDSVGNLASTGGWTLAKGEAMGYFNKIELVTLTAEQQAIFEEVAKNTYRPCCNNPTAFPDCNHGAALLALLELGASQNLTKNELYLLALQANTLWFPQNYLSTAVLMKSKNTDYWGNAQEIVGIKYSSYSGWSANVYKPLQAQNLLPKTQGGGSCGV
ncbi:MAG: hypothetical protein HY515_00040 [Candidatus Aenigmarchaeota archaeon]|nr:hypothetical protein [Candidatus Aenigmarchaeota archaeon]